MPKFNSFVNSKKNGAVEFLEKYKPQTNKKQIKIKTKDRFDYKFYKRSVKLQNITKSYYKESINKRVSKIDKHSKFTYKKHNSPKSFKKTIYLTKKYPISISNTKSYNHKKYPFKRNSKLRRTILYKVKSKTSSFIKGLIRWK